MPEHIKARIKHRYRAFAGFDFFREPGGFSAFFQRDLITIQWQAVILRAVDRGKAFKLVQCPFFLKHMRQKLHGVVGGKDPGPTTRAFLAFIGLRR